MGSLASELLRAGFQPKDVNFLTVEGKMDEADFTLIRDYMPNLVSIDMTNSNATAIPDYTFTQRSICWTYGSRKSLEALDSVHSVAAAVCAARWCFLPV